MRNCIYILFAVFLCLSCEESEMVPVEIEKTLSENLIGNWRYKKNQPPFSFNSDVSGTMSFESDETGIKISDAGGNRSHIEWDLQVNDTKIAISLYPEDDMNASGQNDLYDINFIDENSIQFYQYKEFLPPVLGADTVITEIIIDLIRI